MRLPDEYDDAWIIGPTIVGHADESPFRRAPGNYRSAVIYGRPQVTDPSASWPGCAASPSTSRPGQWDYARQPSRKEPEQEEEPS